MSARGALGLALLMIASAGCRPTVAKLDAQDGEHPLMRRALTRQQSGDLDGAVQLYHQVLDEHPRTASAHLSLALLLHDYRQHYIDAIYHYRAYLRMRPDTQKSSLIRDRIRVAEQLLAAQLARRAPEEGVAGLDPHAASQIQALNQRLARSEQEKQTLTRHNVELDRQLADMQREVDRLRRRVEMLTQPPGTVPTDASAPSVRDLISREGGAGVRTYEVQPGDTLSRIAQIGYGDAAEWRRIRDANRDKVDGQDRVQPGQVLVIPSR